MRLIVSWNLVSDMIINNSHFLSELIVRYPELSVCKDAIFHAYEVLADCFSTGHKLLIAGNGGSCSDSEHIVGELMKGFILPRKCNHLFAEKLKSVDYRIGTELSEKLQCALPTIALGGHQSLNTAFCNDVPDGAMFLFAQQVYGYGKPGDVFWGISTSGNSKSVINATVVAHALGMKVIGLTGNSGGQLSTVSDVVIKVPSSETYMIYIFRFITAYV